MKTSSKLGALVAVLSFVCAFQLVGSAGARSTPRVSDDAAVYDAAAAEFAVEQAPALAGATSPLTTLAECSSGAHSLSQLGARVYPEMGNGGYTSLHTDLHLNYDAIANLFLAGTHADLQVKSTQCLSDLSFDFEQTNGHTADGSGPNMMVNSVEVNGQPATFRFVQPTYPGDPNGQDDPDLAAHAVSNSNPVSATNPNPPACSPQVNSNTQNGTQCPANKLVVIPSSPIPAATTFTVTIDYTGRPGVHTDGDGSTEGWFRIATVGSEGAFVTTEPVGNDSWMPMNNFPTGKPTYDIYDTTNIGKVAIGPGELVGYTAPVGTAYQPVPAPPPNPPDANFPAGSVTWHWHSPEPIANYLVENSIGAYDLSARTSPTSGVQYWEAQASTILATRKATNKIAMDNQEDIVNFQQTFNGPWPMTTDGIVVGTPPASFEEEMQGKITFAGGTIGGSTGTSLGTFNHENMHQWFGDTVAEAAFNLTFWKEGFATLGEYLSAARTAAAGASSGPAFETRLQQQFTGTPPSITGNYNSTSTSAWISAPSNPTVNNLFTTVSTYTRPGTAYLALWQTLGRDRMIDSMKDIQSTYGGKNITEPQLENVFRRHLAVNSASCNARLTQFFTQWFDTPYPSGNANTTGNKPSVTGPGLAGTGFVCGNVQPSSPDGQNGWYKTTPTLTWSGYGSPAATKTGCVDGSVPEGMNTLSCSVVTNAAPILNSGPVSEMINVDSRKPVVEYTGGGAYTVDETVSVDCAASDPIPGSGLASDTCEDVSGPAYTFALGEHSLSATATDVAGNVGSGSTSFTIDVTFPSLEKLVARFSSNDDVASGLNDKLAAAASATNAKARGNQLNAFDNQVRAQTGKALTADEAKVLIELADALR